MPTRWNLDRHLRKHRIANAFQLATFAHIGYPAADRIWKAKDGTPLGRFDLRTLDRLAHAFGVRPLSLLTDK
jgi:hypothetical protein